MTGFRGSHRVEGFAYNGWVCVGGKSPGAHIRAVVTRPCAHAARVGRTEYSAAY